MHVQIMIYMFAVLDKSKRRRRRRSKRRKKKKKKEEEKEEEETKLTRAQTHRENIFANHY